MDGRFYVTRRGLWSPLAVAFALCVQTVFLPTVFQAAAYLPRTP